MGANPDFISCLEKVSFLEKVSLHVFEGYAFIEPSKHRSKNKIRHLFITI